MLPRSISSKASSDASIVRDLPFGKAREFADQDVPRSTRCTTLQSAPPSLLYRAQQLHGIALGG